MSRSTRLNTSVRQADATATFAGVKAGHQNTIVLLGNSRIGRGKVSTTDDSPTNVNWFAYANALSGNRFNVVHNAGVSGDTLAQMLARWDTDVAPYNPAWVLLCDACNDAAAGQTAAQMQASTQAILDKIKGIDARAILCTSTNRNDLTAPQKVEHDKYNRWVKSMTQNGVAVADVSSVVIDPSNGNYAAAYTPDGTHQNADGAARIGQALAPILQGLVPARDPFPPNPTDAGQALLNPWMNGTPGATLPTSWTSVGSGTFSTVARSDLVPGNWAVLDTSAAASDSYIRQIVNPLPSGFTPGVNVQLIAEVMFTSLSAITQWELVAQFRNSSGTTQGTTGAMERYSTQTGPVGQMPMNTPLIFRSPVQAIPATSSQVYLLAHLNGQGVMRVGRTALVLA